MHVLFFGKIHMISLDSKYKQNMVGFSLTVKFAYRLVFFEKGNSGDIVTQCIAHYW